MIERNKHPAGRFSNIVFGIAQILDGMVRVISLGHLHSRLPIEWSKVQVKRQLKHMKAKNENQISH